MASTKHSLPGCNNFDDWDRGDGSTGLRHEIKSGVREQKDIIQSDITVLHYEEPLALNLVTSFLTNSVSFAEQLIDLFMVELFYELKKMTEHTYVYP